MSKIQARFIWRILAASSQNLIGSKRTKWPFYQSKRFAAQSYTHRVGQNPLVYRSVGQELVRSLVACGDRIALVSVMEDVRMTFQQVKTEAETLAVQLGQLGLQQGDHLGIWNLNTKQWYITWLAASLGGFPLVCINAALQPPEVAFCLKKAKVKGLITTQKIGPLRFEKVLNALFANNGRSEFPDLCFVLMQGKDVCGEHFLNYDQVLGQPAKYEQIEQLYNELELVSPESACCIQFTSGTTGEPKAAVLTHFNMVNLAHVYGRLLGLSLETTKKCCLPIPLFHVFGLSMAVMCLHFCNTLVIPGPFFKGDFVLDVIAKEQCNQICGTPAMYVDFIESQKKNARDLKSLEVGYIGGATVSPEIYLRSRKVLGLQDMRVGYGLSESTCGVIVHDGCDPEEEAAYTIGSACEHCEAKVINDCGETVPIGQPGELCLRGFFVMKGYFDDDEETRKTIRSSGWLHTGDEVILQPDGKMTFEGRKKNLIIRGGENIFPKEIQNFLVTHEYILEAQVIGVPDERLGEEICAYLRLKEGTKLTEADIKTFCENKLARFKIPKYVRFVEDFPRTATGKIQKFKLKELFINEQTNEQSKKSS